MGETQIHTARSDEAKKKLISQTATLHTDEWPTERKHQETKTEPRAVLKESALYAPIKKHFEVLGYQVRAEVRHCDMVAIQPDEPEAHPIIVELKSSFNVTLLLQAMERMKLSPYVYVAVAKKKSSRSSHSVPALQNLCERLGLGFLLVTFYKRKAPFVATICHPPNYAGKDEPMYKPKPIKTVKTRAARLVREFHARSGDYNVGGVTKQPLVTAYREKALRVVIALQAGPLRAVTIRSKAGVDDAASVLQRNYYGWFARQSRGIYALTPLGYAALTQYAETIALFPKLSLHTYEEAKRKKGRQ